MRRLSRILLNAAAAVSLVLCVATPFLLTATVETLSADGPSEWISRPLGRAAGAMCIGASFLVPAVAVMRLRNRLISGGRPPPDGRCAACGYDLRATPGRCPECGAVPAD